MYLLNIIQIELSVLVLIVMGIIIIVIYFAVNLSDYKVNSVKNEGIIREKNLRIEAIENDMKGQAHQFAQVLLEQWKTNELEAHRKEIMDNAQSRMQTDLHMWKIINTDSIRKDAANRSSKVLLGKVSEHLIPYSEYFGGLNPRDAKFIGSPIDFLVFDGASEETGDITIHFVEIKTGTAGLTKVQKRIKAALDAKPPRLEWKVIPLKDFGDEVSKDINASL